LHKIKAFTPFFFCQVVFQRLPPEKRRKRKKRPLLQPRSSLLLAGNDSSSQCDGVSSRSTLESDTAPNSPLLHPDSPNPDCEQVSSDYEEVEEEGSSKRTEAFSRLKNSERLCPCTAVTIDDLVFMTLTLGNRHSLTWESQVDILQMFGSIFTGVKIPQSKTTYIKNLFNKEHDINYHVFCDGCHSYIGKRENRTGTSMTCTTCQKDLKVTNPSNSFVTLLNLKLKPFSRMKSL